MLSGGGDGSVARTRLGGEASEHCTLGATRGKPRIVKCLSDRVLIMDDEGNLYSYGLIGEERDILFCDNRLASYCVLDVSGDGRVAMCGLTGLVISGRLTVSGLENVQVRQLARGKIFSLGVSAGGQLLISDKDGKIVLADETLSVMAVGELPMMKDRWFTASTVLGECFVIGDRCGGVHFMARSGDSLVMRMSYPRLHGRHGVTQLLVDGGVVWSSGRDGQVRGYTLSEKGARLVQTVRVSHDWVAGVRRVMGQLSVMTWHGAQLEVRTLDSDTLVTRVQCGGGHRSWDVVDTGSGGQVVYIKEGRVRHTALWSGRGRSLVPGVGHAQHVNTLSCGAGLLVTGGEDTFIRVHRASTGAEVAVLRGHLSSVKCLHLTRGPGDSADLILVSGGGRAELRVWSLVTVETRLCCSPLASLMLRPGNGGRGSKKAWRLAQTETRVEGETRLMSVDTVWAGQRLMVGVACSDSSVRVFAWSGERLETVCEARQHHHCLLQLRMIPDTDKILTGTTGGHLSVWRLREDSLALDTEVGVHQSGVNCLDLRRSESGLDLDIVTGGDDTSLVLTRYTGGQLNVIWKSDHRCGHTTQLTGLRMVGDLIITSGVDQRLVLWRHSRTKAGDTVNWEGSKCVSVADISSLVTWSEAGVLSVVLVGVGMERVDIRGLLKI